LKLLNSKQVEYLVIGGWAVGFHGYPRSTGDIDIWVSRSKLNASKLVEVLKDFGFDVPNLSANLFTQENQITRLGAPPIRIEILTSISGVSFEECYKNRQTISVNELEVNIIGLEDLKKNKLAAGRFRDLDDLEKLNI
jgi:predicted nucleotidyltransferase